MADDDEVVCPLPALRKVRRRVRTGGTPRTHENAARLGQRWVDRETDHFRSSLHASRLTAKEPITHAHPQACEPRCADVFKHYLACADRIEQKGAGAGAAS